jgi:hypothetical protein
MPGQSVQLAWSIPQQNVHCLCTTHADGPLAITEFQEAKTVVHAIPPLQP